MVRLIRKKCARSLIVVKAGSVPARVLATVKTHADVVKVGLVLAIVKTHADVVKVGLVLATVKTHADVVKVAPAPVVVKTHADPAKAIEIGLVPAAVMPKAY